MNPKDPDFVSRVRRTFSAAPFVTDLGLEVDEVGPGWCESILGVAPRHLQQQGFVHAGVLGAMADHTAGGAASSLVAHDEGVLTTEYSIHLIRAAKGARLRCRATVLKPGSRLIIVEAEVSCDDVPVSKMTATVMVIHKS